MKAKYVRFFAKFRPSEAILEGLPFLFGQTIKLAVVDKIRYGGKIVLQNDGVT